MSTIDEIVTNGSKFAFYYSNGEKSRYVSLEQALEKCQTMKFTSPTIKMTPNFLLIDFEKALKMCKKLETKFWKIGVMVSYDVENEKGSAKFNELGNSKITITKPSQL